jgi:hypothetical protein
MISVENLIGTGSGSTAAKMITPSDLGYEREPICMAAGSVGVAARTVTERSFCVLAGSMPGRRRARDGVPRRAAVSGLDVTPSAAVAWRGPARIVPL